MSSFPNQRPQGPGPRPGPGGAAGTSTVSLDPVKLLKKYAWAIPVALVVGLGIGLVLFIVMRVFFPRYTAEVTFEVKSLVDPGELGKNVTVDDDEIERFMATQRDRLTSDLVLRSVATDIRLAQNAPKFAQAFTTGGAINVPDAVEELQNTVNASIVQGTYYIRLRASHADDNTAAGLAELVQLEYEESLKQDGVRAIAAPRRSLDERISELTTQLSNLNAQRQRLIRDQGVDAMDAERTNTSSKLDLVNAALIEVTQSIEANQVSLDFYESMLSSDTGIQYTDSQIANVEFDPAIQTFQAQINQLSTDRKSLLRQGLTAQHRTVRNIDNQIAATQQQMEDVREQKLRKAFDAELDQLRQQSGQLQAQAEELREEEAELNTKLVDTNRILGEIDEIDRQIAAAGEQKSEQERELGELDKKDPEAIGRISVVQRAQIPDQVSSPQIIVIPAVALLFCGLVGAVIVALELLDQRVKTAADVAMIPRTRVVGVLPDIDEDPSGLSDPERVFKSAPNSVLAEHYRQLRSSLFKSMDRAGHRTLLVAGCQPKSGATSVVLNTAFASAAAGRRTLVIDANYRRPALHTLAGVDGDRGLAEILSGKDSFDTDIVHTLEDNLDLLSVGSKGNRIYEQLGSETMSALLAKASETYDAIILDVSPALVSSDAATLANRVDASVLVVRALSEKRGMVARLKREFDDSRGEFLGVIVNAVRSAAGGYLRKNIKAAHEYQFNGETPPPQAEPELKSA